MIVALFFAPFATLGLLIPRLGQRLYGRMANEPETRLVDRTQRGLRAFLVFLLALTLNDVREKFVRMDAEAAREAGEIDITFSPFVGLRGLTLPEMGVEYFFGQRQGFLGGSPCCGNSVAKAGIKVPDHFDIKSHICKF